MSLKKHNQTPYDFGKISVDEQMRISKEKMRDENIAINEVIGVEAKKKLDRFRSRNVQ